MTFHVLLWPWFLLVWTTWRVHLTTIEDGGFAIRFILNYICWVLGLLIVLAIGGIVMHAHTIMLLREPTAPLIVSVVPWITLVLLAVTVTAILFQACRSSAVLASEAKGESHPNRQ